MSENSISLDSPVREASMHYLETYIRHHMKPVEPGYSAVTVVLGEKDTAWSPDGGLKRGPAGLQYVLVDETDQIMVYDDDEYAF